MVTHTITVPIMYKDITFLDDVTEASRQKVLKFVKDWKSKAEWIEVTTSGSTGNPKIIKLSKNQMRASAMATVDFFELKPGQNILLALSTDYIAGKMMIIRGLEHKLKIIIAPLQSNPLKIKLLHHINFSAFVPLQVQTILSDKESRKNYEAISKVIIGGAVINEALELELQSLNNLNYATFGMTETISHIALRDITRKEKHYSALPSVKFSVDTNSCLIIDAPLICSERLATTDCVDLLNENQFIWKGRNDFVINSGGIKLHPEEIEKKILSLLPNNRYYISSEKDDRVGQKIVLKIEKFNPIDLKYLKMRLKNILTKYELPKEIVIVSKFKLTKTNKIIRL